MAEGIHGVRGEMQGSGAQCLGPAKFCLLRRKNIFPTSLSRMADGDPIRPSDTSELTNNPLGSFIDHVMTPGSTIVSPTFLLMVDVTLLSLLFLFLSLVVLTWSPHFVALGIITLGLWGSVKLYVALV